MLSCFYMLIYQYVIAMFIEQLCCINFRKIDGDFMQLNTAFYRPDPIIRNPLFPYERSE